ncbi:MAG: hypothetical protein WD904_01970 [Dehalococcoidia bacterium]
MTTSWESPGAIEPAKPAPVDTALPGRITRIDARRFWQHAPAMIRFVEVLRPRVKALP